MYLRCAVLTGVLLGGFLDRCEDLQAAACVRVLRRCVVRQRGGQCGGLARRWSGPNGFGHGGSMVDLLVRAVRSSRG